MKKKKFAALTAPFGKFIKNIDFVRMLEKISQREPGKSYMAESADLPPAFADQKEISRLAVELAERSLAEKGDPVGRRELESQADIISCQYDHELHKMLKGASFNIIPHLFKTSDLSKLFISHDARELKHAERLKKAQAEGRGVVYLINHTSHWDEFIFNVFLDQNRLGLPLFAAGENMMVTPSLTKIFMIGSYVIVRSGASRAYLSTLYHYCQALGEMGKQQGIFLEAWSGGARTRDGSLRYPRRLIALQGALAARNDVLVQPVVISYSRVPEDQGLSEGKGLLSWLNGNRLLSGFLKQPWRPVDGLFDGLRNIYGRTYVGFGQGKLLSELRAELEDDPNSELTLDEYASLYAIKEIARDKKIMTSQIAARAVAKATKKADLLIEAEAALGEIKDYHQRTFGHEPDLEDFFHDHTLSEALADGLESLTKRKIIEKPWPLAKRPPKIKAPHALAYYATHGDRRLYSPSAKENFVVCGCGSWAYGLVSFLGRRTLADRKFHNSSLTLYDHNEEAIYSLAYERTFTDRFPDHRLPKNIFPTTDHTAAFRKATEVIVAVPPNKVDATLKVVLDEAHELRSLIIASRGFDPQSHRLTMQIAWETAVARGRPKINILALTGPFSPDDLVSDDGGGIWILAGDVSPGRNSEALLFKSGCFRVQVSSDPIGVQMAAALADAYTLYGQTLGLQRTFRSRPRETADFIREVSAEAKSLALALGGQPQTFEADNPAWTSEFIFRALTAPGTVPSWLGEIKSGGRAVIEDLRVKLGAQWPEPTSIGYFSIHSAYLTAKHLGLKLPHLEAANELFWG